MRWLFASDWGAHELGWLFFRHDRWSFPIGRYRSFLYPIGSTLGYSDSIPVVGVVAKLLSPLLPSDFQYFGGWLAACFMLQGYLGARLTGLFFKDPVSQSAGGALFVMSPTLLLRVGHPSLCAHWLLLWMIWLHLRRPAAHDVTTAVCLTALAGAIHPYLALMVLVLTLALLVRSTLAVAVQRPALSWSRAVAASVVASWTLMVVLWIFGYAGAGTEVRSAGFGFFSADLTTFVDPRGYSVFLGGLPAAGGQYEGFAYLGGGILLLAVGAIGMSIRADVWRAGWRAAAPLGVSSLLMALFAASDTIRFGGRPVLRLSALYSHVLPLAQAFRSSGRFIWPLHYVCIAFALGATGRACARRPLVGRAILLVAAAGQLADLNLAPPRERFSSSVFRELRADAWPSARGAYDHIALYPLQIHAADCGDPWDEAHVYRFAHLAYRLGMSINSGYVARFDGDAVRALCRATEDAVTGGRLDGRTIYVVSPGAAFPRDRAVCGRLDDREVCVAVDGPANSFRDALARHDPARAP